MHIKCPDRISGNDLMTVKWRGGVCYVYRPQFEAGLPRLRLYRRSGLAVFRHLELINRPYGSEALYILRENIEASE